MFYLEAGGDGVLHEESSGGFEMTNPAALSLAYMLDLVIGDPRQIPHPVRGIGWIIEKTEGILRKGMIDTKPGTQNTGEVKGGIKWESYAREKRERYAGILLVIIIAGSTYLLFYLVSTVLLYSDLSEVLPYLSFVIYIYLISTTIATRELLQSGQAVLDEIVSDNIEGARERLGMIVGRDTKSLDRKGILKAVIETLSENSSDGIIAPLFYFAIGGLPLAMTYKAINTLDSMVGYKNERYKNFGWASARLDDMVNFIPARITGMLIVIAACILGGLRKFRSVSDSDFSSHSLNGLNAFRYMLRDGRKHSSPNSGIPEAAMAGAVGVQLGGPSSYGGVIVDKPYIGEELHDSDLFYIHAAKTSVTVTKITSFLGLLTALSVLYMGTAL